MNTFAELFFEMERFPKIAIVGHAYPDAVNDRTIEVLHKRKKCFSLYLCISSPAAYRLRPVFFCITLPAREFDNINEFLLEEN